MKRIKTITARQWLGAMGALIGAIFLYYGISADSLTTWGALWALLRDVASNPAVLIASVGAVYAYFKKRKEDAHDEN